MDSSKLRSLFERLVHQVVIESNSVGLRSCVVPAQYDVERKTLVVSDELSDGDLIRASIAALLHYDYKHSKKGLTLFTCKEMANREYSHISDDDIAFIKKFLDDNTTQLRFTF